MVEGLEAWAVLAHKGCYNLANCMANLDLLHKYLPLPLLVPPLGLCSDCCTGDQNLGRGSAHSTT